MNIELYGQAVGAELMDLLLTADPDEEAVRAYLPGSQMLVCREAGSLVSVAVLTRAGEVSELKNIAVLGEYQGRGITKKMIDEAKRIAKGSGATVIEVGTGNSSLSQLALYQKCGFRMHSIEAGFFDAYPEPIFENGIRCRDMVRLRADL